MEIIRKILCTSFISLNIFFLNVNADEELNKYIAPINLEYADSGIGLIDCVYVINLEKRPEKWIESNNSFLEYSIKPNRVNAFDGWKLTDQQLQKLMGKHPIRMRGGQMGCLISHLSVIKDAYNRGFKCIWVCEDDVIFNQNPHSLTKHIFTLSVYQPKWDILFTDMDAKDVNGNPIVSVSSDFRPDFKHEDISYYLEKTAVSHELIQIRQRFGTYSMIISRSGMAKILNHYEKLPVWTAYDIEIHYIPNIEEFALINEVVTSRCSKISDTEKYYHVR